MKQLYIISILAFFMQGCSECKKELYRNCDDVKDKTEVIEVKNKVEAYINEVFPTLLTKKDKLLKYKKQIEDKIVKLDELINKYPNTSGKVLVSKNKWLNTLNKLNKTITNFNVKTEELFIISKLNNINNSSDTEEKTSSLENDISTTLNLIAKELENN